jgi:hypothetical protein
MGRTCGRNEPYEVSSGKLKRPLRINLRKWEDNIKINVTENADWIHLARGTLQYQAMRSR